MFYAWVRYESVLMLIIFLGIRASMAVLVGCFTGNFSTCKRSINQVDDDHAGALIIILSFGGKFSAKIIPRESWYFCRPEKGVFICFPKPSLVVPMHCTGGPGGRSTVDYVTRSHPVSRIIILLKMLKCWKVKFKTTWLMEMAPHTKAEEKKVKQIAPLLRYILFHNLWAGGGAKMKTNNPQGSR